MILQLMVADPAFEPIPGREEFPRKEPITMRVFISVDMEGIAGITTNPQREPGNSEYQWGRELQLGEANAAIEAAFEAGAREVVVNDSHNNMDNLYPAGLDRRARLITGNRKPLSMMQGIGSRFDAALFIGYHARRGSASAIMDHTYCGAIDEARINGKVAGESMLNGLFAGSFGVPLVLVSGDQTLQKEVRALNPAIETVVVKEGITSYSALNDHPEVAREKIRAGVLKALAAPKLPKPLTLRAPYRFEVTLALTHMADMCALIPGVERKGSRTLVFRHADYASAYRTFLVMMRLASSM